MQLRLCSAAPLPLPVTVCVMFLEPVVYTGLVFVCVTGDLDPDWIESMNSLMDDNKLLTLANNDRIYMPPNMRVILETADIQFASPATVSRAGAFCLQLRACELACLEVQSRQRLAGCFHDVMCPSAQCIMSCMKLCIYVSKC